MTNLPPPDADSAVTQRKLNKKWYMRWWVWAIAVLLVIAAVTSNSDDQGSSGAEDTTPNPSEIVSSTGGETEDPVTTSAPTSTVQANGQFGDGTKIVGTEVKAGRYLTITASSGCYWERMSGFSGGLDDIIANEIGSGSHLIVQIEPLDKGFKSNGCGTWIPYSPKPAATITDGDWAVNDEIAPGLWKASESTDCYWARLSGFGGTSDEIIANELQSDLAQIKSSDVGFTSTRCGTWTKVG